MDWLGLSPIKEVDYAALPAPLHQTPSRNEFQKRQAEQDSAAKALAAKVAQIVSTCAPVTGTTMATTSLKPIADVQKLAAILAKNLKIVDTYVQRRQEINDALQALEEQNDNVRTESKDLLMQQRLKLEDELPQHLGRIRAVAGHLRRALIDKLNGEMTEAAARVNSVINRLYIIRSTIGVHSFAQATMSDTVMPSFVDGRDLIKSPIQIDPIDDHVVEASWEQDDSAVALHHLLQPYHQTELCLEQLWFEQTEAGATRRQGAGGLIPQPIR